MSTKRILAITVDPAEAPFRLRIEILRDLLAGEGFEFHFRPRPKSWWQRRALVASADQYDAVIIQRKLLDPSHARLLKRRANRVLYDIDDAVMLQRRKIGRISQWLKQRRFLATAKAIDHVVAGNNHLAQAFREQRCPATILPTVVDPNHYRIKQHTQRQAITMVWIGSRSTLPYVRQWLPALEAAARRLPGLKLLTIANDTVKSDVLHVEHLPWSLENEAEGLARGDIGIAPTPLDPWTLGKCGFKIIQYMATGLPAIASPVGANAEIIREGITGFLPATPEDWPDAIVRLANDPALRAQMGTTARAIAEQEYSLARAKEIWRGLLSGVPME